MPSGVVPLPQYLQTNPNAGVENYLRAKAMVQQRQAQLAQEQHQKDQVALQAQAQAQQNAIHQQELGLRQQAQKAAVDTAAQRLQQQQSHEEARQREAAAEQTRLNAPPEYMDLGHGATGVRAGRTWHPLESPGAIVGLNEATPVLDPSDPSKTLGYGIGVGKNRTYFQRSTAQGQSPEEKAATKQKDLAESRAYTEQRDATKFARDLAAKKASSLEKLMTSDKFMDMSASEQAAAKDELAKYNAVLEGGSKAVPAQEPKQTEGVRLRRKKDGKILKYLGDPADVPDEFEILE